jgi:hypothetical protein
MGAARSDYAASESADRGRELEVVLNDGAKESGGRHEQVAGPNIGKAAEQICQELLNQYEVSYARGRREAGRQARSGVEAKGVEGQRPVSGRELTGLCATGELTPRERSCGGFAVGGGVEQLTEQRGGVT